jgi:2-polyprenyl-3-methyl-5-hydroxy-6-metoxy-1,4-benzoquinol methylase
MTDSIRQSQWDERYRENSRQEDIRPRDLLLEHPNLLHTPGLALDVAMGLGGNADFLIPHGFSVVGIDLSRVAVAIAKHRQPQLQAVIADLNDFPFPENHFDVICNFYYYNMPLFGRFRQMLKPGGVLFLETLLEGMSRDRPEILPERLAKPGEIRSCFSDMEIRVYREGWQPSRHGGEKCIVSLVAVKS